VALMLLLLVGIFVALPVGVFFVLRRLARRWVRTHASHPWSATSTPPGLAIYACWIVVFVTLVALDKLQPNSPFVSFIRSHGGLPTALVLTAVVAGIAAPALRHTSGPRRQSEAGRDA
jgi:polyferredoxin